MRVSLPTIIAPQQSRSSLSIVHKAMRRGANFLNTADRLLNKGFHAILFPETLKANLRGKALTSSAMSFIGKHQNKIAYTTNISNTVGLAGYLASGIYFSQDTTFFDNPALSLVTEISHEIGISPESYLLTLIGIAGFSILRIQTAIFEEAEEIYQESFPDSHEEIVAEALTLEPTLEVTISSNKILKNHLDHMESLLKNDPAFLEFLGYNRDSFDLIEILKESKIIEADEFCNIRTDHASHFHNYCAVKSFNDRNLVIHELIHLLHFESIKRAIQPQDIQKILEKWSRIDGKEAELYDFLQDPLLILNDYNESLPLTEEQRFAALDILVTYCSITGQSDYFESVASRYEYDETGIAYKILKASQTTIHPFSNITAILSGTFFTNYYQQNIPAYLLPGYASRYFDKGLINAIE